MHGSHDDGKVVHFGSAKLLGKGSDDGKDSKIVAGWHNYDSLGYLQQVGLIPALA